MLRHPDEGGRRREREKKRREEERREGERTKEKKKEKRWAISEKSGLVIWLEQQPEGPKVIIPNHA